MTQVNVGWAQQATHDQFHFLIPRNEAPMKTLLTWNLSRVEHESKNLIGWQTTRKKRLNKTWACHTQLSMLWNQNTSEKLKTGTEKNQTTKS